MIMTWIDFLEDVEHNLCSTCLELGPIRGGINVYRHLCTICLHHRRRLAAERLVHTLHTALTECVLAEGAHPKGIMAKPNVDSRLPALVAGKWPRDLEIALFNAMFDHKPVGVSKHFEIVGLFHHIAGRYPGISIEDVWAHLNVLYDLELLEEKEAPEEDSDSEERALFDLGEEEEFSLPTTKWFEKACSSRGGTPAQSATSTTPSARGSRRQPAKDNADSAVDKGGRAKRAARGGGAKADKKRKKR